MPDPRDAETVDASTDPSRIERQYPCAHCGAKLMFVPGTSVLKCPYCAFENQIQRDDVSAAELDYTGALASLERGAPVQEALLVKCGACAADVTPPPNVTAFSCPYCGTSIVATAHSVKLIKPNAVLPFAIRQAQSRDLFRQWITSRWFAPNTLRSRSGIDESIVGVYIPAWTFDTKTVTAYTGQRGDAYYVTVGSGKNRTTQRRIRWSHASGVVRNAFDDVLVLATRSLPDRLVKRLEPWDLKKAEPYSDDYLAGFRAESYQVDLAQGFETAKQIMSITIRATICRDIGGDEQRIDSMKVQYNDITFKHVLLPVWISAYRYRDKVYRFIVNARTGEVQGDRPYSAWKIALLVISILFVIAVIIVIAKARG
ncbi:MAG: hypothetical protein AB7G11_10345 [Phycisphaerales bacterium]